jgi:hypothetical protein
MKFTFGHNVKYFLLFLFLGGCIIVRHENTDEENLNIVSLSPKPEIPMSEDIVLSTAGDMVANIPLNWFFVDVEDKVSSDIIAVAVNPDYSLCAVFSTIRKSGQVDENVEQEGLVALARVSFDKHVQKSGGLAMLIGDITAVHNGTLDFAQYEYSCKGGTDHVRTVVFKSDIGQYYDISMMQMNFNGKEMPTRAEFDKIFRSIIATVQY